MKDPKEEEKEKIRRQVAQIHHLAVRLPWIAVLVALISWIFIILYVYFQRHQLS
ncbi:MAG: hypothetical protein LLG04_11020 [Parachlamydia sp.]|nr:hypothetical protein [Parachlamydia sp.]